MPLSGIDAENQTKFEDDILESMVHIRDKPSAHVSHVKHPVMKYQRIICSLVATVSGSALSNERSARITAIAQVLKPHLQTQPAVGNDCVHETPSRSGRRICNRRWNRLRGVGEGDLVA